MGEKDLNLVDDVVTIRDNGGSRSGQDRRQNKRVFHGEDKRSGEERRQTKDRRSGLTRRQKPDRRNTSPYWDGSRIERRDAFRKGQAGKKQPPS
jgi:hypothetical protein